MDQLDDIVRQAMQALGENTPRGYFEELPARIDARLEAVMQTDSDRNVDQGLGLGAPPAIAAAPSDGVVVEGSAEDSGLHDIKALARSAKQRVSRITSQHDVHDSMLSSSASGLRAVALPDPAKMIALPSVEEARAMASGSFSASAAAAEERGLSRSTPDITPARSGVATAAPSTLAGRKASRGVPVWLWAGGGIAAAAAALLVYVSMGDKGDKSKGSAAEQADSQVASRDRGSDKAALAADEAPGRAAGSGAASTGTGAGSAVAAPMAPGDGITVTGLVEGESAGTTAAASPSDAPKVVAEAKSDRDDRKKDSVKDTKSAGGGAGAGGGEKKKVEVIEDKGGGDDFDPLNPVKGGKDKDKGTGKADDKKAGGDGKGGAVLGAGDADELGIGDALGGGDKKDDKPTKTELSSRELRDGLNDASGKAKACYGKHGVTGTVKVKLTVDNSGKVSKAAATGEFAGTPSGDCVASALKTASFPAWTGAPMSTTYAVLLSD